MNGWQFMFLIAAVAFSLVAFVALGDQTVDRAQVARFVIAGVVAMIFVVLTGCASRPIRIQTVEVKVPVAVQPIKPTDVPTPPAPLPPKPKLANGKTDVRSAGDILLSRWCEAVSYFLRADPLLQVSAGEQPKELANYPECEKPSGGGSDFTGGIDTMKIVEDLLAP